ncbi:PREDICTED: 101 kDa malaria antigen-like [Amphimedon queenslandica]|uniref:Uncharacterized protein n=1 Tax=Amphimedon queenslandica TaxID=400682 RepID=A0A1X7ST58_AMPQE|nr:PREDICTED: 101 kDa malaria antigen-like [Amphimedon queenslandica]|eukprot:XP_019862838.1 PREDICTED: 101 kDa malaria antigen-like [Amphimedon queenslandica]
MESFCLSVHYESSFCLDNITVGGCVDRNGIFATNRNIAMLTELVNDCRGKCQVGGTYDSKLMTGEHYKKKYQQQLQTGRRIWLEEYQKPRKGDTADIEQTVQTLMKSLEEKEREAQAYHQQLEQKDMELLEKDRVVQEKDRELQEKDRELRESEEAVRRYQQQALTDDHWVIDNDELTLTMEELGRGSYAVVTVGILEAKE